MGIRYYHEFKCDRCGEVCPECGIATCVDIMEED